MAIQKILKKLLNCITLCKLFLCNEPQTIYSKHVNTTINELQKLPKKPTILTKVFLFFLLQLFEKWIKFYLNLKIDEKIIVTFKFCICSQI